MLPIRLSLAFLLFLGLTLLPAIHAADSDDDAEDAAAESSADEEEKEPKTVAEVTEDSDRIDGLLTLYRDRKNGDVRLLLRPDQLDRQYIYFGYTESGVAAAGQFRGRFIPGGARLVRFSRHFDRIELVVDNSRYEFDENAAIARAAGANVTPAVIGTFEIEAEDEDTGECLINVNRLFLSESLTPVANLPDPESKPHETFQIGKLSDEHSKIRAVRNYPANTDVVVEYVFQNDKPYVTGGDSVTDPRAVSITLQHSFIEAPPDGFEPRYDDPRVGYFTSRVTDLSSTEVAPYRDRINRWKLVKQNPGAEVSKPVEPIVFWIENTTPVELRPVIEQAALAWNEAFLEAGFEDAIEVRTQPDDAEWDAGDIRYHVIRWVSSPEPPFGGYGPSFADPRTGQIIGADIILEHVVIGSRLREYRVFGASHDDPLAAMEGDFHACTAAHLGHLELSFGRAALDALGAESAEQQRLLEEFMFFLVLHEIGHTLGLNHNFRSSYLHSLEDIFDPATTYPTGLSGSVMDYPVTPFVTDGEQGQFWTTRPGPYDKWAIQFGYSEALKDPEAEAARLDAILARSTEPELAFANDADDMRSPGKAIDPRAMVNDMSSDPIGFAETQMAVVETVVPELERRLARDGGSYQELLNGFFSATNRYLSGLRAASRHIGGVHVDRAMVGQAGASAPLTPVDLATQRRAMALLWEKLFAPGALRFLEGSADRLLAQRRGFDHRNLTEDPKLHAVVLDAQTDILDHLLHPAVMRRLSDTRAYGNEYSVAAMLTDLTDAIFEDDIDGEVESYRQNLQIAFVDRLLGIINAGGAPTRHDHLSQSIALNRLRWIEGRLRAAPEASLETTAHREAILYRIKRGLDESRD